MLNTKLKLNQDLFIDSENKRSPRDGFGKGIVDLAEKNKDVITLSADLSESIKLQEFKRKYPDRFIQMGISEQNMCSVSAGLAMEGKIPFVSTHAVFLVYRAWDQIRLSIAMNNLNVKLCGSHEGFSNGPDGASAQPLEDIALMRVLPNMVVINTIDFEQTRKAVSEMAKYEGPVYLRFSKSEVPNITTANTPFKIGQADVLIEGSDVTLVSCGTITYETLQAVKNLKAKYDVNAELISSPTIKPLDEETILKSVKKTGSVVTVEEHQENGGLGGAVSELLSEKLPSPLFRIGMPNSFGESGKYKELLDKYGLSSHHIENKVLKFLGKK